MHRFCPVWRWFPFLALAAWSFFCDSSALAQTQIRQGQNSRSVNALHERLKQQADQAYREGDFAKAIELTSRVLAQRPRDHVAYLLRASSRVELGQIRGDAKLVRGGVSDAREAIRNGGSEHLDYYLPYLFGMTQLAAIENRKEHADVALEIADQVLARPNLKREKRANFLYQRALIRMQLENYRSAADDFAAAIAINRDHLGAMIGLADAYVAAGQTEQALESFGRAISAFPDSPLVYNNRGMFLQQRGDSRPAIDDFTKAIQLDANYLVAYTNRGFARMEAGELRSADQDFTQSLRINPDQPTVVSLRGTARLMQGRVRSAIEDYESAIRLDPNNPIANADVGFARFFAGDFRRALAAFDRAVQLDANLKYLRPWQYLSLVSANRSDAAQARFASLVVPDSQQRDWVDSVLAFLLGSTSAEELLRAVDRSDPVAKAAQTCEAHYFIGRRMEQSRDNETATAHYREALKTGASHLSAYRGAQYALNEFQAASKN